MPEIVTVLANMAHFLFGLPILAGFLVYYRQPLNASDLVWFPLIVFTQLLLTIGLALIVSALTVHFRDLKDLLANLMTLWFFATPIVCPMHMAPGISKRVLNLNPFSHLAVSYQEVLFYNGSFGHWKWLLALLVGSAFVFLAGYALFDRLRDSFGGSVSVRPIATSRSREAAMAIRVRTDRWPLPWAYLFWPIAASRHRGIGDLCRGAGGKRGRCRRHRRPQHDEGLPPLRIGRRFSPTIKSALLCWQPGPRPEAGRDVRGAAWRVVPGTAAAPTASSGATAPARARC